MIKNRRKKKPLEQNCPVLFVSSAIGAEQLANVLTYAENRTHVGCMNATEFDVCFEGGKQDGRLAADPDQISNLDSSPIMAFPNMSAAIEMFSHYLGYQFTDKNISCLDKHSKPLPYTLKDFGVKS